MTQDEIIQMLHKVVAENQNFTTWTVSTPHLVGLVNHAIAKERERILQLIKELRPAIKPLDGMGRGKTTDEWFDILVQDIEEKL